MKKGKMLFVILFLLAFPLANALYHPADSNNNYIIEPSEITQYITYFKRGLAWTNGLLDGGHVTNAQTIFKIGNVGQYRYDPLRICPGCYLPTLNSNGPTFLWFNITSNSATDEGWAVARDSSDNIIAASSSNANLYLIKFDKNANKLWDKRYYQTISPNAIATDLQGNIYVTGYYYSTQSLDGGRTNLTGGLNAKSIFIVKYLPDGTHSWSKGFYSTSTSSFGNDAKGIALDSNGNVYITGYTTNANFSGGALSVGDISGSLFVASFDSNGNHRFSKVFDAGFPSVGNAIAIDSSANMYVTGYFQNSLNLDGNILTSNGYSGYLVKLDGSGRRVWHKPLGNYGLYNPYAYGGNGVTVSPNGDVSVTGTYLGTMDLGGQILTANTSSFFDIFFARFSTNGVHIWSKGIASSSASTGRGFAATSDALGNTYFTGRYYGNADFGNGKTASYSGSINTFVAKYSPSGVCEGAIGFNGNNEGRALTTNSDNHAFVTGYFSGSSTFGGHADKQSDGGGKDVYLVRVPF